MYRELLTEGHANVQLYMMMPHCFPTILRQKIFLKKNQSMFSNNFNTYQQDFTNLNTQYHCVRAITVPPSWPLFGAIKCLVFTFLVSLKTSHVIITHISLMIHDILHLFIYLLALQVSLSIKFLFWFLPICLLCYFLQK